MLDECMTNKAYLTSIKTDSAYIVGEINTSSGIFIQKDDIPKDMKSNLEHIMKYPYQIESEWNPNDKTEIKQCLTNLEKDVLKKWLEPLNKYEFKKDVDHSNDCVLIQGDAGSGKTHQLRKDYYKYKSDENNVVRALAFTHSAVENLVVLTVEHKAKEFEDEQKEMTEELFEEKKTNSTSF